MSNSADLPFWNVVSDRIAVKEGKMGVDISR